MHVRRHKKYIHKKDPVVRINVYIHHPLRITCLYFRTSAMLRGDVIRLVDRNGGARRGAELC